jgi:hypothetical protein
MDLQSPPVAVPQTGTLLALIFTRGCATEVLAQRLARCTFKPGKGAPGRLKLAAASFVACLTHPLSLRPGKRLRRARGSSSPAIKSQFVSPAGRWLAIAMAPLGGGAITSSPVRRLSLWRGFQFQHGRAAELISDPPPGDSPVVSPGKNKVPLQALKPPKRLF